MPIDLLHFVRKWNASTLTERSAAQQHFRDLCEALDVPHPTEADEIGASYTYEKRVSKAGTGEQGYADVWKRGFFAWEYKSKGGDLKKAYKQLNEYHESLDNPHLLIVCDFVRFEVHTKFENVPTRVFAFTLDDLLRPTDTPTCALPPVEVLRACFLDTNPLRPGNTAVRVTRAAASDLLRLATQLEGRLFEKAPGESRPASPSTTPLTKEQIAHFLMRIVFCLFADSIGLLPEHTFRNLVLSDDRFLPTRFRRKLRLLFEAMSEKDGIFGPHSIRYFNGGLFTDDAVIDLDKADLGILASAASHDWSHIEPTIFGTLFERSLDAAKRSLIGAHYTSTEDILLLIEPVVIQPLLRRWQTVRAEAEAALAEEASFPSPGAPSLPTASPSVRVGLQPSSPNKSCAPPSPTASPSAKVGSSDSRTNQPTLKLDRPALRILTAWCEELARVRILDPACGSGNFLYVALRRLLDLWWQAQTFASQHNLALLLDPIPNPQQLFGIETDFYAHEIASVVVWIGFLQWKHEHALREDKEPLLQALNNIQHDDAILRYDPEGKPYEPQWPPANYIVGNPPFLGGQDMKGQLSGKYVDELRGIYANRVPGSADLVLFWFEKARESVAKGSTQRVGLIGTQAIRGGENRKVLQKIKASGDIFWARSDRKWPRPAKKEGKIAMVQVSMVAFDNGSESLRELDGEIVPAILANLKSGLDTTTAHRLIENHSLAFKGPVKVGKFEVSEKVAGAFSSSPNPHGIQNSSVLRPWMNGNDIKLRPKHRWIIDFHKMSEVEAALFEQPFEYLKAKVFEKRQKNNDEKRKKFWWRHGASGNTFRKAVQSLDRFIVTTRHSKHRIFLWAVKELIPDSALVAVARADDYFFGVVHSRVHEIWTRDQGTQLRDVESGFRYTPESTFDTFPFPWPPGAEPTEAEDPRVHAIAEAARELVRLRDNWLNPPGASEADLKDRTLTKLYNLRAAGKATWLDNLHRTLDEAVFAAYGWPANLTTQQILANLLALNHQRAAAQPKTPLRKSPGAKHQRRGPSPPAPKAQESDSQTDVG